MLVFSAKSATVCTTRDEATRKNRRTKPMSTAELIYEKAQSLPATLQSEALQFVAYLASRLDAASEAVKWQQLMRETQAFVAARGITDGDIADEVAAVRGGR
jgi:hypothetical protein